MNYTFRTATTEDAAALSEIYAPYVEETAVSFEYVAPTAAEFARRISDITRHYPYIVLLDEHLKRLVHA